LNQSTLFQSTSLKLALSHICSSQYTFLLSMDKVLISSDVSLWFALPTLLNVLPKASTGFVADSFTSIAMICLPPISSVQIAGNTAGSVFCLILLAC